MLADHRPNVIWIIDDQHRAQASGYMGDPNLATPNLDRLAQEGINFTHAVSGYPLCCPYRGSMLTGRYPHHCVPGHEYQLPPEQPTIAHALRQSGYHTAYFGKWHVDGFKERNGRAAFHIVPPERRGGFEHWVGYENNNSPWDSWVHGGQDENAFLYKLAGYETDALTDLLLAYLEEQARPHQDGSRQPFFAVLSVQPPHNPYDAPDRWRERHTPGKIQLRRNVPEIARVQERARRDLAGYYAQIENIDWNLGRVIQKLSELALRDETHLLFFSDHGDMHGSHGQFHKTAPGRSRFGCLSCWVAVRRITHTAMGPAARRSTTWISLLPPSVCAAYPCQTGWKARIILLCAWARQWSTNRIQPFYRLSSPPGMVTASTGPGAGL